MTKRSLLIPSTLRLVLGVTAVIGGLAAFSPPMPADVVKTYDGRVLTEYISEEFMAMAEVRFQEGDGELTGGVENPFSQEEMESLEERLRALGYIG